MEITGKIHKIQETETYNNFSKKNIIIKTEEQYPQYLSIEFQNDKIKLIENKKLGENITIGINLRGKEWTSPIGEIKYFISLVGWKVG